MKTEILSLHPEDPQIRLINHIVKKINAGGVIVFPTESGFSIGSALNNKPGVEIIRKLRNLSKSHDFTLILSSVSQIGEFAKIDNDAFRLIKRVFPGPYTFIFEATKNIPNRLVHKKKKTIGIRVSSHSFVQKLIHALGEPIMSVSLIIKGHEFINTNDVINVLQNKVDLIIESGFCPPNPTTVIDCTKKPYEIIRKGAGDTSEIF